MDSHVHMNKDVLIAPIVRIIQMGLNVKKMTNYSILEGVLCNCLGIIIIQISVKTTLRMIGLSKIPQYQILIKHYVGQVHFGFGWQNTTMVVGVCLKLRGINFKYAPNNALKAQNNATYNNALRIIGIHLGEIHVIIIFMELNPLEELLIL